MKGMERSGEEGDSDVSDAIAAQVRRLAMEVRQLASARQITVMNGVSGGMLKKIVTLYLFRHVLSENLFVSLFVFFFVFIFVCVSANLQALAVPAAALGALGYGYMWWKVRFKF